MVYVDYGEELQLHLPGTCLSLTRRFLPSLLTSLRYRNIPGVALYMTSLTQLRALMATSPYFASVRKHSTSGTVTSANNTSVLPTLTNQGNLLAGATTRVGVGFLLSPFSVLKARFEVRRSCDPSCLLVNTF